MLWHRQGGKGKFDWHSAAWSLHVPMIRALFEQIAQPSKLRPLGLEEPLDLAAAVLNRVDRVEFFKRFEDRHAVQYFYEPFLESFDPDLRKQLGVWYTPEEIVRYMVARVDQVLVSELGIMDGLADPNVYVLDPCCGTGTYLVETLRVVGERLKAKGADALAGQHLKRAMTQRIFGFEILPAPFVVSHLQIGLLLSDLGAPLAENDRAGVYLTNALTGWEPPKGPKQHLMFPELEAERDAAEDVKREKPILVIMGNPPYNGYAGVAVQEERDLSNAYRATKNAPPPQGQGLNDLYVRFFRMGERRIVERSGRGIVCFISNYSWLDGLSFTGMRERYYEVFDRIWIDNLNGDKYRTGKLTPEGAPDPSVFSTEYNREGIQVGTAIALLVRRKTPSAGRADLRYKTWWGKSKLSELDAARSSDGAQGYGVLTPAIELGAPFAPTAVGSAYLSWPRLTELFPVSFPGVKTSRDDALVDIDRNRLVARMRQYFDPAVSDDYIRQIAPSLMETTARYNPAKTRKALLGRGFLEKNVVKYYYRPLDTRWLYYESETKLLDEKRAEYFSQVFPSNIWLSAGQRNRKDDFYQPQVTALLSDHHIVESNVGMFPLLLRDDTKADLFSGDLPENVRYNLSEGAGSVVCDLQREAVDLFFHAVAVLHSPSYRRENLGALRQDWPRVPIPNGGRLLLDSAKIGRELAALLDTEKPVPGVTSGEIRHELRNIAVVSRVGGGSLRPEAGELALTAGWGHAGKGGITMPGKGKVETHSVHELPAALGARTYDIYLNDVAYWRNITESVWDYTIGGYQAIKKWLSYRERELLGRDMTIEEIEYVTEMARRVAAILLLSEKLDENYRAVCANTHVDAGVTAHVWTAKPAD